MTIALKAAAKYRQLKEELHARGHDPEIVVVTKYIDASVIRGLYDEGIRTFGENRVAALTEKNTSLSDCSDIQWHFIGHLQRNKLKFLPPVSLIHSVASVDLVKELDKFGNKQGKIFDILLEINTGGEDSKYGLTEESDLEQIMLEIEQSPHISAHGFMTMAPYTSEPSILRDCFRKLNKLREKYLKYGYTELSMGMTNDYRIALEEGATIVRIGSYFFEDD